MPAKDFDVMDDMKCVKWLFKLMQNFLYGRCFFEPQCKGKKHLHYFIASALRLSSFSCHHHIIIISPHSAKTGLIFSMFDQLILDAFSKKPAYFCCYNMATYSSNLCMCRIISAYLMNYKLWLCWWNLTQMFGFCSSFTDRDPECAECKKADEAIEKAKEK